MAGKITSMSKIKQVLIMHRNGMSNRKIASALSIDKCTVNEYVRKAKTCNLSLKALLLLEGPELEAQMFAGNPATDTRYVEEQLRVCDLAKAIKSSTYGLMASTPPCIVGIA